MERSSQFVHAPRQNSSKVQEGTKLLAHATTDGTLADFRLSTQITDDPESPGGPRGDAAQQQRRRTSSGERTGGLYTAKSIKPMDVLPEEGTAEGAMRALSPLKVPGRGGAVPAAALSGVPLLSPEEFESEVSLLRVLGAGGAGSVHEGVWRGRSVAVKVLHPSRQSSLNAVLAFQREVDLMARIGAHPHIVSVLGACLVPPHMSIIQELAERGSLHAALHDEGLRPQYGARRRCNIARTAEPSPHQPHAGLLLQ